MNVNYRLGCFFAVVLFCIQSTQANSAAVYSQSPPLTTGGYSSDFAETGGLNQQAQRFSLGADTDIQAVVAWGRYSAAGLPPDNFTLRIFADNAGAPEALPLFEVGGASVVRENTGLLEFDTFPIYRYTFNLAAPVALSGSTTYYFSVVNNTNDDESWSWVTSATTNDLRWHRDADGVAWLTPRPDNLAFELHDAPIIASSVPVMPLGGLVLTILGLIIVVTRRLAK